MTPIRHFFAIAVVLLFVVPMSASAAPSTLAEIIAYIASLGNQLSAAVVNSGGNAPSWISTIPSGEWSPVGKNTLADVDSDRVPALNPNYPSFAPWHGGTGQNSIVAAWNGGLFSTKYSTHGALVLYGGGHNSYYGSDVYAFDMGTLTWARIADPYIGGIADARADGSFPDGSASPPHTFDTVEFDPVSNSLITLRTQDSRGVDSSLTGNVPQVYKMNMQTKQWTKGPNYGAIGLNMHGASSAYDRNRNVIWMLSGNAGTTMFAKYDIAANSITKMSSGGADLDSVSEVDPIHDVFVTTQFRDKSSIYARDLANPSAAAVVMTETGGGPSVRSAQSGWSWSDKRQAIIYWAVGSADVWEFKLTSKTSGQWTKLNTSSAVTPPPVNSGTDNNRVYSRFQIANYGSEEVAVVVNGNTQPVYAFRIPGLGSVSPSPSPTPAPTPSPTPTPVPPPAPSPSPSPAPVPNITTWQHADVGAVGAVGSFSQNGNSLTVTGSGADIWGTADEFHFAYKTLTGDGEIIARVDSLTNTDQWAKAGVMMRTDLSPSSQFALMLMTPTSAQGSALHYRTAMGGSAAPSNSGDKTTSLPRWIKITRSGNVFTGYHSVDGTIWALRNTVTITMPSVIFVGLAVTSHNDGVLATGAFSNVVVQSLATTPSPAPSPTPPPAPSPTPTPVPPPSPSPSPTPIPNPSSDFQTRCAGAGVLNCVGFDSDAELTQKGVLGRAGDGLFHADIDTSVKASGAGSLRFEIPSLSGQNSSGNFLMDLSPDKRIFSSNSKFYVQFRQRFSPERMSTDFGGDGWKQFILYKGTGTSGSSCTDMQIVGINGYYNDVLGLYRSCGAPSFETALPGGDYLTQNGDYYCTYKGVRYGTPGLTNCAKYLPDQWMTFYYEISMGQLVQETATNWRAPLSLKEYVAYEGGTYKLVKDFPNFDMTATYSTDGFGRVQFTPYDTHKDETINNPPSYTWYDDVIVSTQPIAAPNGTIPPASPSPSPSPTPSPSPSPTPTPIPSTKFALNARVQVASGPLSVRGTASTAGTLLGTQSMGALGTVTGGPVSSGGYNWWNVNYDSGSDGWSAEDFLSSYVAPPPSPAPTPTPNLSTDFQSRCAGAGVLKCVGFDNVTDLSANGNSMLPANDGINHFAIDNQTRASGNGSLRFDIPAGTGMSRMSGVFLAPIGTEFGAKNLARFNGNNKLYVQFRQRFSKEFTAAINPLTGARYNLGQLHFKQAAINNSDYCGDETIVTEASRTGWGFPILYSDCGSEQLITTELNGTTVSTVYEWGAGVNDIHCSRWDLNKGDTSRCALYTADQWITYYYEIEFGDEDTANTVVRAYVGYPNQPLKQFIDFKTLQMNFDRPGLAPQSIKNVTFLPYITDNVASNNIEGASTWYDDLIISRQPISAPAGTPSSSTPSPTPSPSPSGGSTPPPPPPSPVSSGGGGGSFIPPTPTPIPSPVGTPATSPLIPLPPIFLRPLSVGTNGEDVKELQRLLIKEGLLPAEASTGYFGPKTQAGVQAFQVKYAIVTSGTPETTGYGSTGPSTRRKLESLRGGSSTPTPVEPVLTSTSTVKGILITRTLSVGSRGTDVTTLQTYLIAKGYLAAGNTTGYFGKLTEAAVKAFQQAKGLEAVGWTGPKTRGVLGEGN